MILINKHVLLCALFKYKRMVRSKVFIFIYIILVLYLYISIFFLEILKYIWIFIKNIGLEGKEESMPWFKLVYKYCNYVRIHFY